MEGGLPTEDFALAARVLKGSAAALPPLMTAARRGLAYEPGGESKGVEAPEPGGVGMLLVALVMGCGRRRRR